MNEEKLIIPEGAVVFARGGSNRDWYPLGLFRAVATVDVATERAAFAVAILAAEGPGWRCDPERFLAWLVDVRGILVELPAIQFEVNASSGYDEYDGRPASQDSVDLYKGLSPIMTGPRRVSSDGFWASVLAAEVDVLRRELKEKEAKLARLQAIMREASE